MTPKTTNQGEPARRAPMPDSGSHAPDAWVEEARGRLLGLRQRMGGWGYRPATTPGVEPTSLACLGLLASEPARERGIELNSASGDWLASIQNPDGSLGVSAKIPSPCWTTPYAILLWSALGGHEKQEGDAARWLLEAKGNSIEKNPANAVGHDPTIIGWPWVADTHSWLEPTALAILALRRAGFADHPRVREGRRLILDRAIATGGWNYGNKAVFGRDLRPHPGPTGLALLALAGGHRSEAIERAIGYLEATLPAVRSAPSLGWGLLGLRAWGHRPGPATTWLAESCRRLLRQADAFAATGLPPAGLGRPVAGTPGHQRRG